MSWIITHDGSEYALDGIGQTRNRLDINTIATALSRINRFTGHGARAYSVAEHSLLVSDLLADQGYSALVQLAGLMHDAHEAYIGDLSSPLKWALGATWADLEDRHATELRRSFGLLSVFAGHARRIKRADLVALATERRDLLDYTPDVSRPWPILDTPGAEILPAAVSLPAEPQDPEVWAQRWLTRYISLVLLHEQQAADMNEPHPANLTGATA